MMFLRSVACLSLTVLISLVSRARADDYDYEPPPGYYSTATGTGSVLKGQLQTIMSTGHRLPTYGDLRYSAAVTDRDPAHPNNILLAYNRVSVPHDWDDGITWNREHTWPASRLPGGSPSNGTRGVSSDPHMVRPCNPGINSHRSNDPFGTVSASGAYGQRGSYWFPGDEDKGDIARAMFYTATRWADEGLSLVNGYPNGYEMGDLASLIRWHYQDPPDEFERRRNQAVYSSSMNPSYYTNNRNAFVDRPEFAWSVFMDNQNDTQITTSTQTVDLGRVLVDQTFGAVQVDVLKTGQDGTYYEVSTSGEATSSLSGRYNAFEMGVAGSTAMTVGLSSSMASAGMKWGSVVVDNLDVTTGGGSGRGAQDPDDTVVVMGVVLDHANGSFAAETNEDVLYLDFGALGLGSGTHQRDFDLFNLEATTNATAALDLDTFALVAGDETLFGTDLAPLGGIAAGDHVTFEATFDAAAVGAFSATYALNLSDEDLPGATTEQIFLCLTAEVLLEGDLDGDGFVGGDDLDVVRGNWGQSTTPGNYAQGDPSGDGYVGGDDLDVVRSNWGNGSPPNDPPHAVPEPAWFVFWVSAALFGGIWTATGRPNHSLT